MAALGLLSTFAHAQDARTLTDADQAIEWLINPDNAHQSRPEVLAEARGLIGAQAEAHPDEARWVFGRGLLEARENDWANAKPLFERAAELDDTVALHHQWLGNAIFSTINEVGLLGKASAAGKGRDAYLRAIELDPGLGGARVGLCEFYLNAPGIAGGSKKEAREQALALLEIEGFECHGHRVLGTIHADKGEWAEAERAFDRAIEAAEPGAERRDMLMAWISLTLSKGRDAEAIEAAHRLVELQPDDPRSDYILGAVLQETGRHADSVEPLERACEALPDSASPLWRLAVAYEEVDRHADAHAAFTRFAELYPDHENAKDAAKNAKRLKRRLP